MVGQAVWPVCWLLNRPISSPALAHQLIDNRISVRRGRTRSVSFQARRRQKQLSAAHRETESESVRNASTHGGDRDGVRFSIDVPGDRQDHLGRPLARRTDGTWAEANVNARRLADCGQSD